MDLSSVVLIVIYALAFVAGVATELTAERLENNRRR